MIRPTRDRLAGSSHVARGPAGRGGAPPGFASAGLVLVLLAVAGCPGGGDAGDDPSLDPGRECEDRSDCLDGLVCLDGFCSHCARDRDCEEDEECDPITLTCEPLQGWGRDCASHDECSLGEFCVQGLCLPAAEVTSCGRDADCPEGSFCNRERLVCEEDLGCVDDSRCPPGFYCNQATRRCEQSCTPETAADVCPEGFVCHEGRCVECVDDSDCGAGLTCDPVAGRCRGEAHCFSDRDCLQPKVCNRKTGQCTDKPPPCVSNQDCVETEFCEIRTGRCLQAACTPDSFHPNQMPEEASAIEAGYYSNLTLCDAEPDWFLLPLSAGDRVSVTISPPPLAGERYEAALLSPDAQSVLTLGNLQLDYTVSFDGDFLLRVLTADTRSTYSMQVIVSRGRACDGDEFDPNDDPTRAAELALPGAWYNLEKCPGEEDWFVVSLDRGFQARVSLLHDPLDGALDVWVYDSDGATLIDKSATTGGVETVEVRSTSAGRFFIRVVAEPRVQNSYDLILESL